VASDAGAVDAAVMAVLRADSALMARCPDGVFYGVARPGAAACVIVDRFDHVVHANLFSPAGDETFTYVVTAVLPDTDATAAREAALRIRTVLDGNETLTIAGYALQRPVREEQSLRWPEPNPGNIDQFVQHWGGHYSLDVSRLT
jgi:hypothetical protein